MADMHTDKKDAGDQNGLLGRWIADDPADAFLEFGEVAVDGGLMMEPGEGMLKGSDGCNGVSGWYRRDGDTATIRRGLNTLRACPGVDTWLSRAVSVQREGARLHVLNGTGVEIGVLRREASEPSAV